MSLRVLVTGASGFVGPHLIAALQAGIRDVQIRAAAADVTDAGAVAGELRGFRPDRCIHLAAVSAVPDARRDPLGAWRVNLHGTLNLADAIRDEAPGCTLIFASSAEAYGASFRLGRALDETAALAPSNTYAATKAAADLALGAAIEEGLRVVRLRPFNHTGPGQSDQFVVPAFARQIALIEAGAQPPTLSVGNLDSARDFLDVADVCAAYVACCVRADELPAGAVLNLASGVARRIGDVLSDLLRLASAEVEVIQDPARMRPSDIPVATGDASLARKLLGWQPTIEWSDTLSSVLDHWRGRVANGAA